MNEYNIPKRLYTDGPRKMVSWRLPESLMNELDKVAKEKGWKTTELVVTVLDQFLQSNKENSNE